MKTTATELVFGTKRKSATVAGVLFLVLIGPVDVGNTFQDIRKHSPAINKNVNGDPNRPEVAIALSGHSVDSWPSEQTGEVNAVHDEKQFAATFDDPHVDAEDEPDYSEEDAEGDAEDESLSSYRWDIFNQDEDDIPFTDEDQVGSPEMMFGMEEEATSMTQTEIDFFDYVEGLEKYDTYDDQEISLASEESDEHDFDDSVVSTTLSSSLTASTECDGDIKERKKKKKNKKKKRKNPQLQVVTIGNGKLMSRWQKNCCIRGRRVGNARRTFLSNNLFKECKDRTRSLQSRMSRSCKWIFWSCCEAKALRRFYFFTKTRKNDWCP